MAIMVIILIIYILYIIIYNNNKCQKVCECFVFIPLKVAALVFGCKATQEKKKEKSCVATKDIIHT